MIIQIIIGSAITSAIVSGLFHMFTSWQNRKHQEKIKQIENTIPRQFNQIEDLWNKLVDIKLYLQVQSRQNTGNEFAMPLDEYKPNINKSSLVHIHELEQLIEYKKFWLNDPTIKQLEYFLIELSAFMPSFELVKTGDVFTKEQEVSVYKQHAEKIDAVMKEIQKDFSSNS